MELFVVALHVALFVLGVILGWLLMDWIVGR